MITAQEKRRRRLTYRLVQLVLVFLSVGIVVAFFSSKRSERPRGPDVSVTTDVPTVTQLSAGDAQLFNVDSTVDLILQGDKLLAGLSPKTVAKIRSEIDKAGSGDASGLGAQIAAAVKEQVADKIGMHVAYDIHDIEDIRYEDERIVIDWRSGKQQRLFESVKVDGNRGDANRFHEAEARRFIELVKARKDQITR
jgi:hypothetical protein